MDVRKELLSLIKNLPNSHVYYLSPPQSVKRGFDCYRRGKVTGFKWSYNKLVASVEDNRPYTVIMTLDKKHKIVYSCNCPAYTPQSLCLHVIASLFTLKDLFGYPAGAFSALTSTFRQDMLKRLEDPEEASNASQSAEIDSPKDQSSLDSPGMRFIIDHRGSKEALYFEWNNERVSLYQRFTSIPSAYTEAIYRFARREYTKKTLSALDCPIIFKTDKTTIELKFDESLSYKTLTEITLSKHFASFKKGVIAKKKPITIVDRLVIHPDDRVFGYVDDVSGWDFLHSVPKTFAYDKRAVPPDVELPLSSIEHIAFYIPKQTRRDLVFNGQQPDMTIPVYLLDIEIDSMRERTANITPCMYISGVKIGLHPSLVDFFYEVLSGSLGCLRKYNTRRLILERVFSSMDLRAREDAASVVKFILDHLDETTSYKHRKQLSKFLSRYLLLWQSLPEWELRFIKGHWYQMTFEEERHLRLFETLYECFDEDLYRYSKMNYPFYSLQIPHESFQGQISQLYSIAKSKGIEVRINGKPIRTSTWSIEINLTKDIDWFELHPDIRRNGVPIPEEVWEAIMAGKTEYFIENDAIEIMDGETKERLRQIIRVIKAGDIKTKPKEIIRIPRLQVLDWIELRQKGIKMTLPLEEERVLERLLDFKGIEPKPLPVGLQAKVRHYQRDGYNWLCFLYEHRLGGCLADDMGLGKTIQTIILLAAVKEGILDRAAEDNLPNLIVVPPSLLFNWESEIRRFYPAFTVYQYTGTDRRPEFNGYDIVLTSYDTLKRDIQILKEHRFHIIVFDEAQAIKNIHAGRTSAVRQLNGRFKISLTGTPIENHLGEYYSIMDLVIPGLLGEYRNFKGCINGDDKGLLNMFIKRTRPFVLRRTKEAILKDLPPKVESDIYLNLTPSQKALYERTVKEVRAIIDEAYETKTQAQAKIIVLSALTKLRQICLCPTLLSDNLDDSSPKIDFLIERLNLLINEDHSALVFSQFTSFLNIVEERISTEGLPFVRLDGSTPVKKRKEIVKTFQDSKEKCIFLLSLKAGGQGLNLTKASYIFHLDPWWNPAVEMQATDRAHRIGQTQKVNVIRLLMRHSIEEKISLLKQRKRSLYDAVLGTKESLRGVEITREDIEFLLN